MKRRHKSSITFASQSSTWLGLCTITFSTITAGSALAQTSWDGGGADSNWSNGLNWLDDIAPVDGDLTFTGATQLSTNNDLAADTTFTGINFTNTANTTAFTLGGNRITLGGNITTTAATTGAFADMINLDLLLDDNRALNPNTSHNLTVNGLISDGGNGFGLTKTGAGTLTLTNANNTFAGIVNIQAGTLAFSNAAALGSGTAISIGSGTTNNNAPTLLYTGNAANATLTRNITLTAAGNGTTNFNVANNLGNLTIGGNLSIPTGNKTINFFGGSRTTVNVFQSAIHNSSNGNTSVSVTGFTILGLSGNSTYTGATSISNGQINVSNLSDTGASNVGLGNRINLGFGVGVGTLNYTGSGHTTARTLQLGGGTGNGDIGGGVITSNGNNTGALVFTATNFNAPVDTGAGANATNVSRTLTLGGTNTGNNSINGIIADNLGTETPSVVLTKSGASTWILGGVNTYTGATTIQSGILEVKSLANAGTASSLGAPTGTNSVIVTGTTSFTPGILLYTGNSASSTNRQIQIGTGAAPNSTGGATILSSGTGALTFSNAAFNTVVDSGANSTAPNTTRLLTLGGTNTGDNTIAGAIVNNSGNETPNVAIAKTGASRWILSGANTYSGNTTISEGTLSLGASNTLPDTSPVLLGAGTLDAATFADAVGTLDPTGAATISIGSGGTLSFANSSAVSWTGGTLNITGSFVSGASVRFGSSATGLTATQLGLIRINGNPVPPTINSSGFLLADAPADPYAAWSGGAAADGDANNDGVKNGLAWLLGAASPTVNALNLLPTTTQSGGGLQMSFSMLNAASRGAASLTLQHSSDLGIADPWTSVLVPNTSGGPTSGVTFVVTPGSPLNTIQATISSTESANGLLFGRLKSDQ